MTEPLDLPLSRSELDRVADSRTEETIVAALADPATRIVMVDNGLVAVTHDAEAVEYVPPAELAWLDLPTSEWILLGSLKGVAYLAVELPDYGAELTEFKDVRRWASVRDVGNVMTALDAGAATAAVALVAWHQRNPRCPLCGGVTEPALAGWVRRCVVDASEHYPRTDPAVIVAVTDEEDRLLLGHGAQWPAKRFSLIAGFVEPGESLEVASRREVLEETGVIVGEVTYVASQPWPFPASLMLGMRGRALSTDIQVDGVEVTEARWVSRADLAEQVASEELLLPMGSSIARVIIEDWYGGPIGR